MTDRIKTTRLVAREFAIIPAWGKGPRISLVVWRDGQFERMDVDLPTGTTIVSIHDTGKAADAHLEHIMTISTPRPIA